MIARKCMSPGTFWASIGSGNVCHNSHFSVLYGKKHFRYVPDLISCHPRMLRLNYTHDVIPIVLTTLLQSNCCQNSNMKFNTIMTPIVISVIFCIEDGGSPGKKMLDIISSMREMGLFDFGIVSWIDLGSLGSHELSFIPDWKVVQYIIKGRVK